MLSQAIQNHIVSIRSTSCNLGQTRLPDVHHLIEAKKTGKVVVVDPDFVAAALASGTAVVMLVAGLCYGTAEKFQNAFRIMAIFSATAFLIHLFLMYNDFVIHAWYGTDHAKKTQAITLKEYGLAHAFEVLAPAGGGAATQRQGAKNRIRHQGIEAWFSFRRIQKHLWPCPG